MLEAAEDAQLEGLIATTEQGLAVVRERFGSPPQSPLQDMVK
jgi:poly(A) polymerase